MPVEQAIRTERHAAEAAWLALRPGSPPATKIETLKETSKSAVYRLAGIGPKDSPVIAKRCEIESGLIECRIYEDVLPLLGIHSLRYYGSIPEDCGPFRWIFLEDSRGRQYEPEVNRDRDSIAQYVASLHSASRMHPFQHLPNRTPAYYLTLLEESRAAIDRFTRQSAIGATDREALDAVLRECDRLQLTWSGFEGCCSVLPATVLHCDLRPKNIHIRVSDNRVFLLDWEYAGWGSPATDLAFLDLQAYWRSVKEHYPSLNIDVLLRMKKAGEVFQWIAAVGWASMSLRDDFKKSIDRLRSYAEYPAEWPS